MEKMVNSDKNLQSSRSQIEEEENEELQAKPSVSPIVFTICSDDEEANVDLSSKIVEKSMLRACNFGRPSGGVADEPKSNSAAVNSNAIDLSSSPSQEAELMADVKSKKNSRKVKKRENKKVEMVDETVVVAMEEEKAKTSNALEINVPVEPNQVKISDNIVLRKLLRGPRYFDPPDNGWGKCYNCDGEGHAAVNCTSVKRKRPCYVYGSLEHHAKQCTKGQDCFICRKGSHRAKDCPEKYKRGSQNSKICLNCGDSSHDMFLCKNDYSPNDLEDIQCYIGKNLGHLCCVDFTDNGPRELSCYRCGQLGHTGLVSLFNDFLFADRLTPQDVDSAMLGTDVLLHLEEGEYATYHHTYLMSPLTGVRTSTRRSAGMPSSSRARPADVPSTSRAGTSRGGAGLVPSIPPTYHHAGWPDMPTELTGWRYGTSYPIPIEPPMPDHRYVRDPDSPPPPREYINEMLGLVASLEGMVLRREAQLSILGFQMPPLHAGPQAGPSRPFRRAGPSRPSRGARRGESSRRRGGRRAHVIEEESSEEEEPVRPQSETSADREGGSGSGSGSGDEAEEGPEGGGPDSDDDDGGDGAETVPPKRTKRASYSCS